jgi:SAM-dependent methyltransferase
VDAIRRSYDAVAGAYAEQLSGELAGKPVDRAMYRLFAELVRADLDAGTATGAAAPRVGDVGCGPGHVTSHLRDLGLDPVGVDVSAGMIDEARRRFPDVEFRIGSMTEHGGLGEPDGAWAGAVSAYSIVHFDAGQRRLAFTELARAVRPHGHLLVLFHIEDAQHRPGAVIHRDQWWGHDVDLDFRLLDPAEVAADLRDVGFDLIVRTDREPWPGEAPTRRSHLVARRNR